MRKERRIRVGIVTLGCDKNTVDNEYLAGILARHECDVTAADPDTAEGLDAAVVTTCGFIGDAKKQSIEAIMELADAKRETGSPARLFVAGCLTQRYGDELLAEFPEIDGLAGVGQFERLAEMILAGQTASPRNAALPSPCVAVRRPIERKRLDTLPYSFLKIADGCDHRCAFCAIPAMKGPMRSTPRDILLDEARALIAGGARELNLVAQDLGDYGRDLDDGVRLPGLLRELAALDGDFWIRCLYLYPGGISDELLEVIASEPKIAPYIDMPLQHLDPGVLKRMRRPFHEINTFKLVEKMRATIPGLTLRTAMITGFPGETIAEHEALLEGIESIRFERLGVFKYSQEDDTVAADMPVQIPEEVKEERWQEIMSAQAEIHEECNRVRIGAKCRALIEGYDEDASAYLARTTTEAPEVDGTLYIESDTPLVSGEFVEVEITDAQGYDIFARAKTTT
jgi:ribosomal protein S12 methylthiotransferase